VGPNYRGERRRETVAKIHPKIKIIPKKEGGGGGASGELHSCSSIGYFSKGPTNSKVEIFRGLEGSVPEGKNAVQSVVKRTQGNPLRFVYARKGGRGGRSESPVKEEPNSFYPTEPDRLSRGVQCVGNRPPEMGRKRQCSNGP